jgi:hypothetical protein
MKDSAPFLHCKALLGALTGGLLLSLLPTFLIRLPVNRQASASNGSTPVATLTGLAACCLAFLLYPATGFLYGFFSRNNVPGQLARATSGALAATLLLLLQFLLAWSLSPASPIHPLLQGFAEAASLSGLPGDLGLLAVVAGLAIALAVVMVMGAVGALVAASLPQKLS